MTLATSLAKPAKNTYSACVSVGAFVSSDGCVGNCFIFAANLFAFNFSYKAN